MTIYFVRHGHPDYANDCLTPLGKKQAEAAAERLKSVGIEAVYSSTKGRALETAEYTASKLGLRVIPCDFMREIGWASVDGEPILANGHPWRLVEHFASADLPLSDHAWREREPFSRSRLVESNKTVAEGLDAWLAELGYCREGDYYRVNTENTDRVVSMFSHGGASAAAMAHLFNIPFPQFIGLLAIDYTGVTVVRLGGKPGDRVYPRIVSSDASHIVGLETELVYDN